MLFFYLILLAVLFYFYFFMTQFYNIFFNGYAPFISTGSIVIKKIIAEIKIDEQATIYELGCGRARFLRIIEKKFPKAKLLGIENLFSIYLINKLWLLILRSRINLIKKDFFELNLSEADIIYCYLNNKTMDLLGEKFRQECRLGTQIISNSFMLPQFSAEKIIIINNKKIYFYRV